MKIRRLSAFTSAAVLAFVSLFTLASSGVAHAAGVTLYWCEFSSNSSFNTASNWDTNSSCSGGTQEVPVSGDALVFDNTHLNSGLGLTNNISGLDISSITFQGAGSGGYELSGDSISLDSGINDTGTNAQSNTINLGATLTASQTFNASGGSDFLSLGPSSTVTLGAYNLTLDEVASVYGLTGTGALTFSGSPTIVDTLNSANSGFSGSVVIASSAQVYDESGSLNGLGTGTVTINSGGSLYLEDSATTGTFLNNLNLAGSGSNTTGDYGAIISCLGYSSTCESTGNTTLTLSGKVALSGNTQVVNGLYASGSPAPTNTATLDFTASCITTGGYTLSAVSSSSTTVVQPAVCVIASSKAAAAPGSPDTGLGLASSRSSSVLLGSLLISSSLVALVIVARKFSKSKS
ncbi:MAG TPA: hypothetical protein VGF75_04380 [Candidatus Saccharimonadales bacterium]|jgi:hypothetical protein